MTPGQLDAHNHRACNVLLQALQHIRPEHVSANAPQLVDVPNSLYHALSQLTETVEALRQRVAQLERT